MTRTFVSLDIETTGLDPEVDAVTEVAAVRFDEGGRELGVFHSLVNPGRPLPAFVEALTGINDEDLRDAPPLASIAGDLERFAGGDPVVGHNVAFDLGFLGRGGCRLRGPALDTAALARALLPSAPSHSLPALVEALGLEAGTSHRALSDARAAAALFLRLRERAAALGREMRLQLARLLARESVALAEILAGEEWKSLGDRWSLPRPRGWTPPPPLAALPGAATLDPVSVLESGPQVLGGFQKRREQLEMAAAVRDAFAGGGHWLIEAGTGVGKSLAYLVPAALHALRTGERVIVSTNTIALQEQLLNKDLVLLRELLVAAGAIGRPEELRVAVLKGRGNYLCYRRLLAAFATARDDPDFERLAARLLLWLPETETGDRSELHLDRTLRAVWSRFSAEGVDCLARQPPEVRNGECFLARARREAESAHLAIVNHALLLADIAAGGSALPPFERLIVDEAHNLEEQATRQFGRRASRRSLDDVLGRLWQAGDGQGRPRGLAALLSALPGGPAKRAGEALARQVGAVLAPGQAFFAALGALCSEADEPQLLVTQGVRGGDAWTRVELAWGIFDDALRRVQEGTEAALEAVAGEDGDDLLEGELQTAVQQLRELRESVEMMVGGSSSGDIVWAEADREGLGALNAAPLDAGPLLWERLFQHQRTVVATSATLTAGGSMRFMAERIGLAEAEALAIGSPFDYRRAALLADVTDVPDPGERGYSERVATALEALLRASGGRALVLFTSHAALRDAAGRTRERLREQGITVLAQDEDGSPAELVRILRQRSGVAVYGTASFWEGVDIRGEALSLLVIVRLPFAVPTDPIHRARSALKPQPFRDYSLPAAILRFRQGFGRLIRDEGDRGVIAVLDRRLRSRSYGRQFVAALPPCTRLTGTAEEVARAIADWLGRPG